MKKWLKFTFVGFFCPRIAREGAKLNFANVIFSLLLYFVVLVGLLSSGYQLSFDRNLTHADEFSTYVRDVFANPNPSYRVDFDLNEGLLSSSKLINSFNNIDDVEYRSSSYNLVIDTRNSSSTYDDFLFTVTDASGNEVDYLPKIRDDSNYQFSFSYRGLALDVAVNHNYYHSYVEDITNPASTSYDKNAKTAFDNLENAKPTLSNEEYNDKLYALFVTFYYPNLKALGASESVPTMQGYYYSNIISNADICDYVLMFDNIFIINFKNNANNQITYDGYFSKVQEHITTSAITPLVEAEANIFMLMRVAFNAGYGANIAVYFANLFALSPITLLLLASLSAVEFIIARRKTISEGYFGFIVVSSSYVLYSSLFAGLAGMIMTIFVTRSFGYSLAVYLFFGILVARIVADIIFWALQKIKADELIEKDL